MPVYEAGGRPALLASLRATRAPPLPTVAGQGLGSERAPPAVERPPDAHEVGGEPGSLHATPVWARRKGGGGA